VGGINAEYEFCMDLDLFTRLAAQGKGRRYSGGATANFRLHSGQKTVKLQAVLEEEKGQVIADYGRPFWSSKPGVMNGLWWIYRKQAAVRLRWERMRGEGV
jgi:hypothetical protein